MRIPRRARSGIGQEARSPSELQGRARRNGKVSWVDSATGTPTGSSDSKAKNK